MEGNTSFQASPIALSPFPRLCTTLVRPLIVASLPPLAFQNDSILFLASADLLITCPSDSEIPVHNSVDCVLLPNICSNDCAHPEPIVSFNVPNNFVNDVTFEAAAVNASSAAIFSIVLVNISAVNQPSFNESLKGTEVSTTLPIPLAIAISSS